MLTVLIFYGHIVKSVFFILHIPLNDYMYVCSMCGKFYVLADRKGICKLLSVTLHREVYSLQLKILVSQSFQIYSFFHYNSMYLDQTPNVTFERLSVISFRCQWDPIYQQLFST